MSVRVCGSRRDGQYVERMVYSMLLRRSLRSRMALQDLKEESLLCIVLPDATFSKGTKTLSVEFRIFLFKSQKPVCRSSLVSCMLRTLCHSFFKGNVHK